MWLYQALSRQPRLVRSGPAWSASSHRETLVIGALPNRRLERKVVDVKNSAKHVQLSSAVFSLSAWSAILLGASTLMFPSLGSSAACAQDTSDMEPSSSIALEQGFRTPPASARPWVMWMWLRIQTTRAAITKDVEEMHAKGIEGAIIYDSGVGGHMEADSRMVLTHKDYERVKTTTTRTRTSRQSRCRRSIHGRLNPTSCFGLRQGKPIASVSS